MPAARFPSLAIKRMGAMTTEQPGIMKRQNHRYLLAQPGERSQVKISTVQIVTMYNVWLLPGQAQKFPSTGITEVLNAPIAIEHSARLSEHTRETAEP